MEFTTEYKEYFHHYRTCSIAEISHLVATEIPPDQLPLAYLDILSADDMTVCLRATMICWVMSKKTMVPREMQLCVVLADVHAKDALVAAGTGSGKTLPIALCILLDDPMANYLSITISPFRRLQVTQESDFNNPSHSISLSRSKAMTSDGKPDANELEVIPLSCSTPAFGVLRFHVESCDLIMLYAI